MEFRYTDAERRALAEAVPDPEWLDAIDDWGRLVKFAQYNEFRADKTGYIARQLERTARECLEEETAFRSSKEETDHIHEIAHLARKLRTLLRKPSTYRPSFALAYFGLSMLEDDEEHSVPHLYRHEVFLSLLDDLISNESRAAEGFAAWRSSDAFSSKHHPGFARFVDAAIISWQVWTDKPAGASKEGGPAVRFLCAAVNPLLTFAEQRGLGLRRGGRLTEAGAGRLFEEIRRLDLPLSGE
ncbi:hypothetical protein [Sinorhizobium fredii]|uniref:hypothetical protein n=1 Tax=Rhizobium fredii TaxID=380 RepID=UPI003511C798